MRGHTSAVVTVDDLKTYIKGTHATVTESDDGSIKVESKKYTFSFKPKGFKYSVKIEATDDPSDADEKVTSDPMKFIAGFLGSDVPGGEHFDKMSSNSPERISFALRKIAFEVEADSIGPKRLSRILRRASIIPDMELVYSVFSAASRTAAGLEVSKKEIEELSSKMKKKGWKVEESENDIGLPELTVDVSGIYEAKIRVDSIPYDYHLSVNGHSNLDEKGETEDPIKEIREYARSHPVGAPTQDATKPEGVKKDTKKDLETGQTDIAPGSEKTLPAGPRNNKR